MQNQQDGPKDPLQEMQGNIQLLLGLMQITSMPVRVWVTKFGTAGEIFFGGRVFILGWLMLPMFPLCIVPYTLQGMYAFWIGTTLLLLAHRFRGWQLRRRGYRPHSQFMGVPRFFSWGFWSAAVSGIGLFLMPADKALGIYLAIAGFAIAVSTGYAQETERSMLRRLRDAKREQEWIAEMMRKEE